MEYYLIESYTAEGLTAKCNEMEAAGWFIHLDTFRATHGDPSSDPDFYIMATRTKRKTGQVPPR